MQQSEKLAARREALSATTTHIRADADRYHEAMQRYIVAIAGRMSPSESALPESAQPVSPPQSGPWEGIQVGDVMTKDVITVDEHAGFKHIVETLAQNRVSAVPVVDGAGKVLGIVSESDLLTKIAAGGELNAKIGSGFLERRHLQRKAHGEAASQLMTSPAIIALQSDSVVDAARVAARAHVRRLPVVDDSERIVGIVARSDLLRAFLCDDESIRRYVNDVVLAQQFLLSPDSITADVDGGVVTLRGRLDSEKVLGPLLEALRRVAGVVAVHSQLSFDEPYRYHPPLAR